MNCYLTKEDKLKDCNWALSFNT